MSLLIDVKVHRLTPKPANSAIGLGLYRVTGDGANVATKDTVLTDGQSFTTGAGTWKEAVLRVSRPVTVTLTKPNSTTVSFEVTQLFVLTSQFNEMLVTFAKQPADPANTSTTISLIYS